MVLYFDHESVYQCIFSAMKHKVKLCSWDSFIPFIQLALLKTWHFLRAGNTNMYEIQVSGISKTGGDNRDVNN